MSFLIPTLVAVPLVMLIVDLVRPKATDEGQAVDAAPVRNGARVSVSDRRDQQAPLKTTMARPKGIGDVRPDHLERLHAVVDRAQRAPEIATGPVLSAETA